MDKHIEEALDLAERIMARARAGRNVVLKPDTAWRVAEILRLAVRMHVLVHGPQRKWHVDLVKDGACVYQIDAAGEIESIDAWARNVLIGRAAGDALARHYPARRYELRDGARVIAVWGGAAR